MEKHKCKLCFKSFMNGKALGGHMSRSHFTNLPLPPKTPPPPHKNHHHHPSDDSASSHFSNLHSPTTKQEQDQEEDKALSRHHHHHESSRENPKKTTSKLTHHHHEDVDEDEDTGLFFDAGSVVLQDRESETESTPKPTRRRSKRVNRSGRSSSGETLLLMKKKKNKGPVSEPFTELETVSSVISDTTSDEDVALCLLMLSRDVWSSDDSAEFRLSRQTRCAHRCDKCNRVFKSSQALGGHRISHKLKNHKKCSGPSPGRKVHECPFCGRVFGSGQALGGHKRSHMLATSSAAANSLVESNNSGKLQDNLIIDLNLPAPMEDGDGEDVDFN